MKINKLKLAFFVLIPTVIKICLAKITIFFGGGKKFNNIWLISERGDDARDNGYFFMLYLKKYHPEIHAFYVIAKDSVDYGKMEGVPHIKRGTFQHYIALFRAEYLISSHIFGYTPNVLAFSILEKYSLIKLMKGKRVFLQHGIMKHDIDGLKYPTTILDLFICGAKEEYKYILDNYHYPTGVVQLTGLARYDTLRDIPGKKQILIMPTWRKWLNCLTQEEFVKSEYFQAYNKLLTSQELIDYLKRSQYTLIFYVHHELQKYAARFKSIDERIIIAHKSDYDVQILLRESRLLITDYSSICFDFAYMNKPIIFYQFDQKRFFASHYHRGYFDESRFGPICMTTQAVINTIKKNDAMGQTYAYEKDTFFREIHNEKSCCENIFGKILNINGAHQ